MVTFVSWVYNYAMNTRDYKIFRLGHYYHVYNRGDNRELVFKDGQDYLNFIKRLKIVQGLTPVTNSGLRIRPVPQGSFTILCYCLMPNHFHFLIRQNTELPIGELINKVITSYAKYFNAKYKRVGNLFQDTFKSKQVDNDGYVTYLSAYIHNNPSSPFNYEYSSLPEFLGIRKGTLCEPEFILNYFKGNREEYRKFVEGYNLQMHSTIKHLEFEED